MPNTSHEYNADLKNLRDFISDQKNSQADKKELDEKVSVRLDAIEDQNIKKADAEKLAVDQQKSLEGKMEDLEKAVYASTGKASKPNVSVDELQAKGFEFALLKKGAFITPEMRTKYVRTDIDPLGGYLAPDEFSMQVEAALVEVSDIRRHATVLTTTRKAVDVPVDNRTARGFWTGQGASTQETQPTFDLIKIAVEKLTAEVCLTEEALEDSVINLTTMIQNDIVLEFNRLEGAAFLNGGGVAVNEPEGILTNTNIPVFTSTIAADYAPEDVIELAAVPKTGYNLEYFMHRSQWAHIRTAKTDENAFVYQTALNVETPPSIDGMRVNFMPDMTKTRAAGEIVMMVADMKRLYRIYDHFGMSLTVDDLTRLRQGIVCWLWSKRTGAGVVQPEAAAFLTIQP